MKSMELSKDEAKECLPTQAMSENEGPRFPWGLRLELNKETLEKLGIVGLPAVGTKVHVGAIACVESVSESAHKDGEGYRSVSLQIMELGLEAIRKEVDPAELLYGKS